jgi:hypothetical protein
MGRERSTFWHLNSVWRVGTSTIGNCRGMHSCRNRQMRRDLR